MTRTVENRHALLPVVFLLPDRPELSLEFVIDTGQRDRQENDKAAENKRN